MSEQAWQSAAPYLFFEVGGVFENTVEDDAVKVGQCNVSPCHHTLSYGKEFLDRDIRETSVSASFKEAGYEYTRESGSVYIDADSDHRRGVEHDIYSQF